MGFAQIQLTEGPSINRPTLETTQGVEESFLLTITDENAAPIDLTTYDIDPESGDDVSTEVECQVGKQCITNGVLFIVAEFQGQDPLTLVQRATVTNAKAGEIRIDFTTCSFKKPALLLGEIHLVDDSVIDKIFKLFVEVVPSLNWKQVKHEPISMSEIRLWSRDSIGSDNFLTDEVEYKDAEIHAAIRRTVDTFNTLTPMLRNHMHTINTFPFRSMWIEGTIGYLMLIAAQGYMRNHLPYTAAGLSIDDKNKQKDYREEGLRRIEEFKNWAKDVKVQLNAQGMWGRSAIYHPRGCRGGGGGRISYNDYFGW